MKFQFFIFDEKLDFHEKILEDEKMENEDELPQTDEVKTILNQLSQLKTKRTDLQNELAEVEIKINELQVWFFKVRCFFSKIILKTRNRINL